MLKKRYRGGGPMSNSAILLAMGLGTRLPDAGHPVTRIGGLDYKILPKGEGLSKGRRPHRTVIQCTICQRWVCAGHFYQHLWACDA